MSGMHWWKLLSWIEPQPGVVGIWLHALSSRHKSRFFLFRPRALEASLGHGAVQPKNVRDHHIRDCNSVYSGIIPIWGVKGTK